MESIQIVILAIVQGLTEFLPISSSAHLILAPHLFGFSDQGLAFDVAVHLGSLLAVITYFRRDVRLILADWFISLSPARPATEYSHLGWAIIIATIPVVIAGLLLKDLIETEFRSPLVIAYATIGFGVLLWIYDVKSSRVRRLKELRWKDAVIIGLMQAIALIPGTSRSGITITAALMLGFNRESAARFSFLLAIPTIAMSSVLVTWDLVHAQHAVDWVALGSGVVLSFAAALITISLFLKFIERMGMLPFVMYRLALGVVILTIFYGR
ncbi:MAG: undecaprenyl-diphosphate phosphatase [bacterium]